MQTYEMSQWVKENGSNSGCMENCMYTYERWQNLKLEILAMARV